MSELQSQTSSTEASAEVAPRQISESTSRRRRRVEISSENDIDNDRVFTNEDVLTEAKAEIDPDSTSDESPNTRRRRRIAEQLTESVLEHDPAPAQRNQTKAQDVTNVSVAKPTIGATISADVVAQMSSSPESTRKRTKKSTDSREQAESTSTSTKTRRKTSRKSNEAQDNSTISPVTADLGLLEDSKVDKKTLKKRKKKLGEKPTGRYSMYVHVDGRGNTQLAMTEGRILTEHYVSRNDVDDSTSIDGNIYLGRVQNVLPGMEAAFIDIATPKNAVLYRADVMYDQKQFNTPPKIEESLTNGQMVLVQVTKNPIAHKGARLTQEVSLAGRFVVLIPNQPETYGISKRLPDDERRRLRRILDSIRPDDTGIIVRTAAEGATDDELRRDMERLSVQWEQIKNIAKKAEKSKTATLLYKEPPLVMRMIREEFNKEFRSIVIDNKDLHNRIKQYVEAITPELSNRIEYYDSKDNLDIYERYHVTEQLTKALETKVWLPSGGSLIIERTEALTVIDVNTGKNVGTSNLEETVFLNNLEAADEIARQLRLRDIGGIIVIDFIDMEIEKNRYELTDRLRKALSRDKTRTQVFEVTELGLVQMTRKRLSEGMVESFADICTACEGRGFLIDQEMVGGFAPNYQDMLDSPISD